MGDEAAKERLKEQFRARVTIPSGRKVTYTVENFKQDPPDVGLPGRLRWQGTVKAKIASGRSQNLLVGFDEMTNFISELPRQAKTVAEAHLMLRPKGVPEHALRQGEWFFTPVSKTLGELLDKVAQRPGQVGFLELENHSTHEALQTVKHQGTTYAVGYIVDTRPGHHAPLYLETWHRVDRNKEVTRRTDNIQPQTRRTWD